MKRRSDFPNSWEALRQKIIGLGESSVHKSYYPELQQRLEQLDRFKALLDQSSDVVLLAQVPSGELVDVNETSSRMLGCSREALLDRSVLELVQADAAAEIHRLLNRASPAGGAGEIVTTALKRCTGDEIPVEMTVRLVSLGDSIYAVIVARDITEHRRAEQRLKESEARYRAIFECAGEGILVADSETMQFRYANPAICRLLGYEREELERMGVLDIHPQECLESVAGEFRAHASGKTPLIFNLPCQKKDGTVIYADLRAALVEIEGRPHLIGFFADVTERLLAEETLRREHAFRSTVIDHAAEGILVCQTFEEYPYVHFTIWNDRMTEFTGYTMEEINRLGWYQTLHPGPEARAKAKERLLRMRQGDDLRDEEWEITRQDGATRVLSISTSILPGAEGVVHVLAMMHDITDRKRAEQALRASDERFRQMAEISPLPISIIEPDGRYIYVNRKFTEVFGYTLETISSGRQWFRRAFPDPEVRRKVISTWLADMSNYPKYATRTREYEVRCGDGRYREILFRAITMKDGNQFIIYEDLTLRRQAEQELARLEKLESVGLLAGGIAHDFNNLLTGIVGNISLARMDATPGDKVSARLREAEKAAARAKDLTQQLLTFSRGGAPVKKKTSLQGIIRDSCEFILSGSKSRCQYDVPADLWLAEVDAGQISQVIGNIVINADHAMPKGGTIRIRAENLRVEADSGLPLEPGRVVRISIQDEGIGIGRDELLKIFDPYFTTKQKGSGLGLATAHSIVLKHGGHITVESELQAGTTFRIYLPATADQAPVAEPRTEQQFPLVNAKILVMDDEELIRKVAGQMLSRLGCRVEFAEDGARALAAYLNARAAGAPFDAVLMDLTIPGGMGGRETIERLRAIDPAVKAIVSSGYSSDPIMADFAAYGFAGVVSKPYRIKELADAMIAAIQPSAAPPSSPGP